MFLCNISMEQSPWEAHKCSAGCKVHHIFMQPKVLSPCSQELTTFLYPGPDETNLQLGFPSRLLPSGFLIKTVYKFLFFHVSATCPAHRITLVMFLVRNTSHKIVACDWALQACVMRPPARGQCRKCACNSSIWLDVHGTGYLWLVFMIVFVCTKWTVNASCPDNVCLWYL
jgi:hypothetical protein